MCVDVVIFDGEFDGIVIVTAELSFAVDGNRLFGGCSGEEETRRESRRRLLWSRWARANQ